MTNEKLYEAIGNISDNKIKEAKKVRESKQPVWLKWGTMVACLCLIVGVITMITHFNEKQSVPQLDENPSEPQFAKIESDTQPDENQSDLQFVEIESEVKSGENQSDPQPIEIVLSNKTTAKVSYGYDGETIPTFESSLEYITEEEMFDYENMYVFRGKVSGLTNVTIDFNGMKKVRCIATIVIDEVYRGNITAGEQITMLLPCGIDEGRYYTENTAVIANLESGMEGIFMPVIYDEESYCEMNGAVLMLKDLATCGLGDGMRWAFLSSEQGLLFFRNAYPGAKNATNLDDIEAYVLEMLK